MCAHGSLLAVFGGPFGVLEIELVTQFNLLQGFRKVPEPPCVLSSPKEMAAKQKYPSGEGICLVCGRLKFDPWHPIGLPDPHHECCLSQESALSKAGCGPQTDLNKELAL